MGFIHEWRVGDSSRVWYFVEVRVGEFFARMSPLDAGAVDEDANLVAIGEDARYQLRDVLSRA